MGRPRALAAMLAATLLAGQLLAFLGGVVDAAADAAFQATFDQWPELRAGGTYRVGFTLRRTAAGAPAAGVAPTVLLSMPDGQSWRFDAAPSGGPGHYSARILFPQAGQASVAVQVTESGVGEITPPVRVAVRDAPPSPIPTPAASSTPSVGPTPTPPPGGGMGPNLPDLPGASDGVAEIGRGVFNGILNGLTLGMYSVLRQNWLGSLEAMIRTPSLSRPAAGAPQPTVMGTTLLGEIAKGGLFSAAQLLGWVVLVLGLIFLGLTIQVSALSASQPKGIAFLARQAAQFGLLALGVAFAYDLASFAIDLSNRVTDYILVATGWTDFNGAAGVAGRSLTAIGLAGAPGTVPGGPVVGGLVAFIATVVLLAIMVGLYAAAIARLVLLILMLAVLPVTIAAQVLPGPFGSLLAGWTQRFFQLLLLPPGLALLFVLAYRVADSLANGALRF